MRDRVIRRDISRSELLDADLDSERFKFKLGEKWYERFFTDYPSKRTHTELARELAPALSGFGAAEQLLAILQQWHPDSGIFYGIAHWSRLERAHRDAVARVGDPRASLGKASLTIPAREPMPDKLAEALRKLRGESLTEVRKAPKRRRRVVRAPTG